MNDSEQIGAVFIDLPDDMQRKVAEHFNAMGIAPENHPEALRAVIEALMNAHVATHRAGVLDHALAGQLRTDAEEWVPHLRVSVAPMGIDTEGGELLTASLTTENNNGDR